MAKQFAVQFERMPGQPRSEWSRLTYGRLSAAKRQAEALEEQDVKVRIVEVVTIERVIPRRAWAPKRR